MSIYNEDELVPPSWINQKFIENVLKEYEKTENLKIHDFDIGPASLKGDHYGSIMFRCKVCYELDNSADPRKIFFIIKTLPEEDCAKRDLLGDAGVFETESSMYKETLPKIEEILAQHGEPSRMGAKLIYYSLEPYKVIIMEDLCEAGYSTIRGRYLTAEEMKLVYKKIAKFHAATFIMGHSEDHEVVTTRKEKTWLW